MNNNERLYWMYVNGIYEESGKRHSDKTEMAYAELEAMIRSLPDSVDREYLSDLIANYTDGCETDAFISGIKFDQMLPRG